MKKQTKEKIINKLENPNILSYLIISIIVIVFYFLCLLPVFFDFQNSILFWKIAMIIGSSIFAIVFLFIIIVGLKLIKKAKKETVQEQLKENKEYIKVFIAFIIVTLAIFIYSCLHYFNSTLWGADLIINGLFFIAISLIAIFLIVEQFLGDTFNNEIKPMVLLSVAFLSLFFAFIFELSNTDIQYSSVLYKISIGIFYLVFIALLVNRIIYNKEEFEKINKNKKIGKIISFVFWASLLLITFPFYINWWGLQGQDFNIFVSIYSAIVGGGLTLLGVAWTIRKGDEDRKRDREQLEQDRKKEEINKAKPFFTHRFSDSLLSAIKNRGFCCFPTEDTYNIRFQANILNSKKCSFLFNRILIDGNKWVNARGNTLLLEGDECLLWFCLNEEIIGQKTKNQTNQNGCYILLEILDMYNNPYYYCLTFSKFDDKKESFYTLLEISEIEKSQIGEFTNE